MTCFGSFCQGAKHDGVVTLAQVYERLNVRLSVLRAGPAVHVKRFCVAMRPPSIHVHTQTLDLFAVGMLLSRFVVICDGVLKVISISGGFVYLFFTLAEIVRSSNHMPIRTGATSIETVR